MPLVLTIEMLNFTVFEGSNQRLSRRIAIERLVTRLNNLVPYINLRLGLLGIFRAHKERYITKTSKRSINKILDLLLLL